MDIGNTVWEAASNESPGGQQYLSRTIGGLSSGGLTGEIYNRMDGIIELKNSTACE